MPILDSIVSGFVKNRKKEILKEKETKDPTAKADDGTPVWMVGGNPRTYSSKGPDGAVDYTMKGDGSISPRGSEDDADKTGDPAASDTDTDGPEGGSGGGDGPLATSYGAAGAVLGKTPEEPEEQPSDAEPQPDGQSATTQQVDLAADGFDHFGRSSDRDRRIALQREDAKAVDDAMRFTAEQKEFQRKIRLKWAQNQLDTLDSFLQERGINVMSRQVLRQAEAFGAETIEVESPDRPGETAIMTVQELVDTVRDVSAKKGVADVGLGTDASRAGEAVVVHILNQAIHRARTDPNFDQDAFLEEMYQDLVQNVASNPDTFLDESWVASAMGSFRAILEYPEIAKAGGLSGLSSVSWDTQAGRQAAGADGHKTSADIILRFEDGRRWGVSLKKDWSVYIMQPGVQQLVENITTTLEAKGVPEAEVDEIKSKIDYGLFQEDLAQAYVEIGKDPAWDDLVDSLETNCASNPHSDLCPFPDDASGRKMIKRILDGKLRSAIDSSRTGGSLKGEERKAIARVAKQFGESGQLSDQTLQAYWKTRDAEASYMQRITQAADQHPVLREQLNDVIAEGLHLAETCGVGLGGESGLDRFLTVFGPTGTSNKGPHRSGGRGEEARRQLRGSVLGRTEVFGYFVIDDESRGQLSDLIKSGDEEGTRTFFSERLEMTFDGEKTATVSFRRTSERLTEDNDFRYIPLGQINPRSRGQAALQLEFGTSRAIEYVCTYGGDRSRWPKKVNDQYKQDLKAEADKINARRHMMESLYSWVRDILNS